jgi:hypothetical protein
VPVEPPGGEEEGEVVGGAGGEPDIVEALEVLEEGVVEEEGEIVPEEVAVEEGGVDEEGEEDGGDGGEGAPGERGLMGGGRGEGGHGDELTLMRRMGQRVCGGMGRERDPPTAVGGLWWRRGGSNPRGD